MSRKVTLLNGNMKNNMKTISINSRPAKIFFIIIAFSFIFSHPALADDASSTQIFNIEVPVNVPANCVATDTDGIVHTYEASSSNAYLGICALEAALASSSISNAEFSNQYPELGIFVIALDGVSAATSSQYWALYQNGNYANFGLAMLPVSASDTITFELHDFSDNNLGDRLTLDISSLIATSTDSTTTESDTSQNSQNNTGGGNGGGGGGVVHNNINVANAISFLEANENSDGSFDGSIYTDWAAIAFAADSGTIPHSLRNYELNFVPSLSSATDYERHAMALEALGINPYTGTGTNYIQKIINYFDGAQIGDPNLINDDIFAIFPLVKAGYSPSDSIIQKVVANIISKQNQDGSWTGGVDMTAAAIQALELANSLSGASAAIAKAESYLLNEQQSNGGFGSDDSTSWALQAIAALGQSGTSWIDNNNDPLDYLYSLQQNDGGIGNSSENLAARVWSTEFAIPAALGKPWASILNSFSKSSNVEAEEVGVSERVVGAESAERTSELTPTSSAEIIASTSSIAEERVSEASEVALGSLVRFAKTTRSPSTTSAASSTTATDTNILPEVAAVGLISTSTPTTGTEKVLLGFSSLLILSGFCLIMII